MTSPGVLTARQILETEWPEPTWAVPGLVPVGCTILAGRPKVGKSWLALQIAQAKATGGMALGRKVDPGACLYLALEDQPARLQTRMRLQGWPLDAACGFIGPRHFRDLFPGDLRRSSDKLGHMIADDHLQLVVVDTLPRAVSGDQDRADVMTAALAPLQQAALQLNAALVFCDHTRKPNGLNPDPVDDVLGSTAKAAVADAVLGLYRCNGTMSLHVVGRDIDEQSLELRFDPLTRCWQAVDPTEQHEALLEAMRNLGPCGPSALAEATGKLKGTVYKELQTMLSLGLIVKSPTGAYEPS